ncbi:MAG: CinA family protein [Alphaproteobacteria bacterium]
MFSDQLQVLAREVVEGCRRRGWMVATAESCTGGLIAACLTEIAGSSVAVDRGFVTYHNDAKRDVLGVGQSLLDSVGAVSEEVARAMAEGALKASQASVAVSCTGVAGPGGGSPDKPVGLVHMAVARHGVPTRHQRMTYGDIGRDAVREKTVRDALAMVIDAIGEDEA